MNQPSPSIPASSGKRPAPYRRPYGPKHKRQHLAIPDQPSDAATKADVRQIVESAQRHEIAHEDQNLKTIQKDLSATTKRWKRTLWQIAAVLVAGIGIIPTLLIEKFTEKQGIDRVFDGFGQVQSTQPGYHIHSGTGRSPYTGYANALARSLEEKHSISGYGAANIPSRGGLESIRRLDFAGEERALSITQYDAALQMQEEGHDFVILKTLPSAPEAVITISRRFNSYADMQNAVARAALTATREDDIVIGLPSAHAGAHITTKSLAAPLDEAGYRFRDFRDNDALLDAVTSGAADMACVVQYAGYVECQLLGSLRRIQDEDIPVMTMDKGSHDAHFAGNGAYRYLDMSSSYSPAFNRISTWGWGDTIDLPPLLAIDPVIIGRDPDSIADPGLAHSVRAIHDIVSNDMTEADMIPAGHLNIREIAPLPPAAP